MNNNRRYFLKLAAMLSGGYAITTLAGCHSTSKISKRNKPFGLQLYTLRDQMAVDPKGILKQVAGFGYKQIESFEGPSGIFWGMGNKGFKQYMDELGMTIISSHCDMYKDFERKANEAAEIGMKYLICPHYGAQKTLDGYKVAADIFNQKGAICKKAGIRFAYHNHEYSFKPMDNQFPQDVMMQHTDKDLVDYEMDIYWVVTAGQSPEEWINKYPDRFKLFHVKDRKKDAPFEKREAFTTLGNGKIDFVEILKLAETKGDPYYVVEQDQTDIPAMEAVQKNADYLRSVIMPKI